ncbi:hypothetical protein FRC08_007806 [Ceratobasidium sp. 394]|nr:hypothetical protein FRC08_007806 [Ceratobasidium sp. 394]
MPPRPPKCQICDTEIFKYTCPKCSVLYCSVACYKRHKNESAGCDTSGVSSSTQTSTLPPNLPTPAEADSEIKPNEDEKLEDPKPLRTLASLKWPYVPEPPSFIDPVTKNDPKPLTLAQYEAIATSPDVRRVIADNPNMPNLLRSVDKLYGPLRQQTLEEMLGVGTSGDQRHGTRGQTHETLARIRQDGDAESNMLALRQLSEAIEKAIGVGSAQRGLAWEDA